MICTLAALAAAGLAAPLNVAIVPADGDSTAAADSVTARIAEHMRAEATTDEIRCSSSGGESFGASGTVCVAAVHCRTGLLGGCLPEPADGTAWHAVVVVRSLASLTTTKKVVARATALGKLLLGAQDNVADVSAVDGLAVTSTVDALRDMTGYGVPGAVVLFAESEGGLLKKALRQFEAAGVSPVVVKQTRSWLAVARPRMHPALVRTLRTAVEVRARAGADSSAGWLWNGFDEVAAPTLPWAALREAAAAALSSVLRAAAFADQFGAAERVQLTAAAVAAAVVAAAWRRRRMGRKGQPSPASPCEYPSLRVDKDVATAPLCEPPPPQPLLRVAGSAETASPPPPQPLLRVAESAETASPPPPPASPCEPPRRAERDVETASSTMPPRRWRQLPGRNVEESSPSPRLFHPRPLVDSTSSSPSARRRHPLPPSLSLSPPSPAPPLPPQQPSQPSPQQPPHPHLARSALSVAASAARITGRAAWAVMRGAFWGATAVAGLLRGKRGEAEAEQRREEEERWGAAQAEHVDFRRSESKPLTSPPPIDRDAFRSVTEQQRGMLLSGDSPDSWARRGADSSSASASASSSTRRFGRGTRAASPGPSSAPSMHWLHDSGRRRTDLRRRPARGAASISGSSHVVGVDISSSAGSRSLVHFSAYSSVLREEAAQTRADAAWLEEELRAAREEECDITRMGRRK